MEKKEICAMLEEVIIPLLNPLGYELVFIDYLKCNRNWILRIYIDKPDGITLSDCEKASKAIEGKLDEVDIIDSNYLLEVCSPGLDRPLVKDKDFLRFKGKKIKLKTIKPLENRKNFVGIIRDFKDGYLTIACDDNDYSISKDNIFKANLVVEI